MSTTLSTRPIADTISFEIKLDGVSVSDVMRGYADSVVTRHHFEQFQHDLARLNRDCKEAGMMPGFTAGRLVYDEDSFRPMFPVRLNDRIEAFASIMTEIPSNRLIPDTTYKCKVWVRDSRGGRTFVREQLHLSIHRQMNANSWIVVFDDVQLRMTSDPQVVFCRGALFDN